MRAELRAGGCEACVLWVRCAVFALFSIYRGRGEKAPWLLAQQSCERRLRGLALAVSGIL